MIYVFGYNKIFARSIQSCFSNIFWKGAKFLSDYSNCLINRFKLPNPAKEPYKFVRKLVEIENFLKK